MNATTFVLLAGLLIIFGIEGAVCILMAAPLVAIVGLIGTLIGIGIFRITNDIGKMKSLALLPVFIVAGLFEKEVVTSYLSEVKSSVIINASPDAVWKNVVQFPQLKPPTELLFKLGISYPIKAKILGSGVNAIRYCEFNSGSFVEPITHWETNKKLSFDVAFQPRPMKELTPWQQIEVPHIDGFFRSRRGEFRLKELPGGRTLLEGSTWYALDIFPGFYWKYFAEFIVHKIHLRVLDHIKQHAELSYKN